VPDKWRLLDPGPMTAAENMALDEVLLTARSQGLVPNTIRFLQFKPHAALVGYHQSVEQEIRVDYCREHDIDINRRLTGGGGLYWDENQLGWEVCAQQKDDPRFERRAVELYQSLCDCTIDGLRRLGVQANFRPQNDIEVNGRKISGTGGTSLDGAFLFQGSLLVDFDVDTMLRALLIPTEKLKDKEMDSVRDRVTCLAWELGQSPELPDIKAALIGGFSAKLDIELEPGLLTPDEERMLAERLPHFLTDEWIHGTRRPLKDRRELRALYKSPGGLIRASLVIEDQTGRIREAFITGDFFAYPRRAILDLEAALKGVPAQPDAVTEVVERIFASPDLQIPGVTAWDMAHTLHEALEKTTYTEFDIRRDEANAIYTVVKTLSEITECQVLLLPYCAKEPSCDYRYQEGCNQCGICCIGDGFALGERLGYRIVSIQTFEHLEETLIRIKGEGVTAFVGSCCEPFYAKHRDDFERIGLPGILVDVDNSTCYDLGREHDAYVGKFENQTYLKMDLLERVARRVSPNGKG
jgi:lipoate---protein ligase